MAIVAATEPSIQHQTPISTMHDSDSDRPDSPASSSSSIEGDIEMDDDQAYFYYQQQQQAMLYQKHHERNGLELGSARQAARQSKVQSEADSDDGFSDEDSDSDSMPDESIDFSLTYALHTFLATVEGQASVVKGDSLVLLDDANSYWWLVRVLKTEDVGYIPAENIETPYERLARLNKHRNIDLAAATQTEKQAGVVKSREKLKGAIAAKGRSTRQGSIENVSEESATRRVIFAPPTYVDHPGVTWSSDEDSSDGEQEPDEVERQEEEHGEEVEERRHGQDTMEVDQSVDEMEPDDGVEWADEAAEKDRQRVLEQRRTQARAQAEAQQSQNQSQQSAVQPKSNNPFAPRPVKSSLETGLTTAPTSAGDSPVRDPAAAEDDTKRITATPALASGPLLPPAVVQSPQGQKRNVSGQSTASVYSTISTLSSNRSSTPTSNTSPEDNARINKKTKKDESSDKKKKGLLGGLFSRKSKDKSKGVSSGDYRSSEESSTLDDRMSEENPAGRGTPSKNQPQQAQSPSDEAPADMSTHSLRLQQQDLARMQSYTSKYLKTSPIDHSSSNAEAAAAVAQSVAAMRLTAGLNGNFGSKGGRPSSIILSPNPDGPPLLNVIRIFAGSKVESEASFKTALINETTSATDLIRQSVQRFHLHHAAGEDPTAGYYIVVKESDGSELELGPLEKPLVKFQDAVARWTHGDSDVDEHGKLLTERLGAITPTVNRTSVSSISSMVSLSSHPAIKKLGMDWEDDSAVKLYINRRVPTEEREKEQEMQGMAPRGMPMDDKSEFSSYSTGLSTVHEAPDITSSDEGGVTPTQETSQGKNPKLTIATDNQSAPERYMSPSARFTLQLLLHSFDLPDGVTFEPSSDALIPRSRSSSALTDDGPRKRLFTLPRNANVVDVIEQGLDRFGVQEGVVDGGDEVEDKVGKRRSMTRVRYSLGVMINGQERHLLASSKILEAYPSPPVMKPVERSTPEYRRRSRDLSYHLGRESDIRENDPVFVLRKVASRGLAGANIDGLKNRSSSSTISVPSGSIAANSRSPAEIIAAQRAASRSHQLSILSSANKSQGVDVVVPSSQGTFRSSKSVDDTGSHVVRYSFIEAGGETYDISELLEAEWGDEDARAAVKDEGFGTSLKAAPLVRQGTDMSDYHTAPSTPEPSHQPLQPNTENVEILNSPRPRSRQEQSEEDILRRVVQRASRDGGEAGLDEALKKMVEKAKEGSARGSFESSSREELSGRITPQQSSARDPQVTPRASVSHSTWTYPTAQSNGRNDPPSSQATPRPIKDNLEDTAASVNRIISRHRQHPSIASIMSDLETSNASPRARERSAEPSSVSEVGEDEKDPEGSSYGYEANFKDRSSTPATATSSTHPTPPFNGGAFVYNRAVNVTSPTPRMPVSYSDDFGMKDMMAVIRTRTRDYRPAKKSRRPAEKGVRNSVASSMSAPRADVYRGANDDTKDVDRELIGEKIEWDTLHPDIKGCLQGVQERLDKFDRDVDDLLASVGGMGF